MTHTPYDTPFVQFSEWFDSARVHQGTSDATAMVLATANAQAAPSARVVLLKAFDVHGFVFYTNLESRKSQELKENPQSALCFYWPWIKRQVRVEGKVAQVSESEADEYFNSRALTSRLGAMASDQSRVLADRQVLIDKIEALSQTYNDRNPPPRPKHWSGWRLVPSVIEFWQEAPFRLHNRDQFTRKGAGWLVEKLYP